MKTFKDAKEKIIFARTRLVLDQPFFGTLALKLELIKSKAIETAMTNGKKLIYNPGEQSYGNRTASRANKNIGC